MEGHMPYNNNSSSEYRHLLGVELAARMFKERQSFALPPSVYGQDALMQHCVAASLAGGIIAASGTPHDTEAAVPVFRVVLARQ